MKTKQVFIALCLPALFTACNNDEWIDNGMADALDGRAKVNLKVNVSSGDQVNTRIVPDGTGGFLWQPTDVLGAVIVDPATLNTVAADKHLVNNRFKNNLTGNSETANFYTDGTTVEGAWMFYYPYNAAMSSSRDGIAFGDEEKGGKCISNQKYDPNGALMTGNDFKVSPVIFVDANEGGETDVKIKPASIYAYGIINAKLPVDATVVNRVVIAAGKNTFNVTGKIDAKKVVAKAALNYTSKTTELSIYSTAITACTVGGVPNKDKAEAEFADHTEVYATGEVTDIFQTGATPANHIIMECTTDGAGVTLANNEFSSRILLPADKYVKDIDVYFYTNAGVYKKTITADGENPSYFKRNHTVNLADVNRTDVENFKTAQWEIKAEDLATDAPIVSIDDLISLIKTGTNELDVTQKLIANASIVFNDAVATALKNSSLTKLIVGDINVSCGSETTATAIDKLESTGIITVLEGSNVVLGGSTVIPTLVVNEDAQVKINAGTYATAVTSSGALSVNSAFAGALTVAKGTTTIDAIVNKAEGAVSVTGGKLVVAAGKTFTIAAECKTLTTQGGEIAVSAGATLALGNAINAGTITNEGIITATAALTNSGKINNGTADNHSAEIKKITNSVNCEIVNFGRIDELNNTNGLLIAKKNSFTNFDTNRGTVDNTDSNGSTVLDQAAFSGAEANSDVFVTLKGAQTNELVTGNTFPECDRIVLENLTWTVDEKNIVVTHKIDFVGSTTVLLNKTASNETVELTLSGDVKITKGKSSWAGGALGNSIKVNKLTVADAGAASIWYIKNLTVKGTSSAASTLTINGTIDNWGTVEDTDFKTISYGGNAIKKGTIVNEKS